MHNLVVFSPTSETLKSQFSSVIDYVGLTKSLPCADEAFDAAAEKAAELVDGFYEAGQSAEDLRFPLHGGRQMSATEELRRLLDERGVEHYDGAESTLWLKDEHGYRASADELSSARLSVHIWCDIPEQAIAATLGAGTCRVKSVKKLGDSFGFKLSCGHSMVNPFNFQPDYCPWCGAKVVS